MTLAAVGGAPSAAEGTVPAGAPGAAAEAAADFWSLLVSARTSEQLCRAWLGILCQWIPGTQGGVLLLHDQGERYAPAAVWPDPERDMSFLGETAQQALAERRGVVRNEPGGLVQCAYPLLAADQAYGVVVLQVAARGPAPLREALRLLHWGAGWLVGLFDKKELLEREQRLTRLALLQDLLLGMLAEPGRDEAARWAVNRIAQGLPCRQVLLARADDAGEAVTLLAVSGTASFEPRANLLAAAREALLDAVLTGADQHPAPDRPEGAPQLAASALADYVQEAQAGAALALPLEHRGRQVGALLLDFADPPAPETVAFAQTLALALAPALALHGTASRSLWQHARDSARSGLQAVAGPRRPGLKLAGVLAGVALLAALVWPVGYRVGAPATVEGRVQRAAVAPFDGFIQESAVRAGDRVQAGDLLARLDDRDLKLEEAKWLAQSEVAERKVREALARGAAVAVQLARAESDEAQAQLALVRGRLDRAAVTAPFDGVVVRGDLTQQLGAPVEQGKVLFEVAPLDAWRVVLQVDERDVLHVRAGAAGELVLSGLPGERHRITVAKVAPVALAEEGRNAFRVEAEVQGASPLIQPGMEGVGKVEAGERSLAWIAFHRIFDWMRYTLWSLGL
jgi:RND family efflux transporter MFP subunit